MSQYRVPSGVLRAELEGEEVLLNPSRGIYHLVNETGRAVLNRLEEGKTLEEVVDELSTTWEQPQSTVQADAQLFVDALLERGLLESAAR
jgi:coenzyme PQQ synthesis protein D (PqqD)